MQLSTKIPLSAIILAGGKSSRMKTQKCLIPLGNQRIVDKLANGLKEILEEIFIVTNFPELYFSSGVFLLGDIYPFKGPMAGLHSAMKNSKYDIFAFACDMPFVKKEIIYALTDNHISNGNLATVAKYNNKIYPLPGIYSKSLLSELERLLLEDKLSMTKLLEDIGAFVLDVANLDEEGLSFININTQEDLEILQRREIKCLD